MRINKMVLSGIVLATVVLIGAFFAHVVEGGTESDKNRWRSMGWLNDDVQTFRQSYFKCVSVVNHATGHVAVSCGE